MKERSRILAEAGRLRQQGRPFALATVVKINGSAYRRPGARLLVTPEGATVGTISGGCLEAEVAQKALGVMETGQPLVEPFDLSDDDLILGFGVGCNGVVHVLIEPVCPDGQEASDSLALIEACLDRRTTGVITTVMDAPGDSKALASRLLVLEDGAARGAIDVPGVRSDAIRADAEAALADGQMQIRTYDTAETAGGGAVEMLFEVVRPPIRLLLFGGGHDVGAVLRAANTLGWPITVVGAKAPGALAERFPEADDHVFLMHPGEVAEQVPLDARSAAVVMNHNYPRDKALVGALLASPVRYVGALGPRRRAERILSELRGEGADLSENDAARLYGPAGLDIGTETPQEIALAIVAEIQAVFHNRNAQRLRERDGRIHEAVPVS